MSKKRKRSRLTEAQAIEAIKLFCNRVERQGETSDASMFRDDSYVLPSGKINVQFLVHGNFGVAEDLFEAMHVLSERKLPAKS